MPQDIVLEFIEKHGLERTRETYLEVLFFGTVPEEIGAEIEAEIPPEFRKGEPGDWEEFE